jgi:uncharacterized damage-inducible protein DinB
LLFGHVSISAARVRREGVMKNETEALLAALDAQRAHVVAALDGLSDEQLRQAVLPSGWTALGMVQHLALDVELFWFRRAVAGEPLALTHGDEAWQVPADVPGAVVVGRYREEIAKANAVIAATPLDAMPAWWPGNADHFPPRPLRETILHVITETAAPAGHLDAFRELTDGTQWLVLTD